MVDIEEASLQNAIKIIREIDFPTLPLYLQLIQKEIGKKEPSFQKITDYISQDIALTAKILKSVNSAAYATRYKIDNIMQALTIIGLTNFYSTILTDAIKRELHQHNLSIENFNFIWKHSTEIATACQFLAESINNSNELFIDFDENHAYLSGLFHDCGIPIMAARYPDYESKTINTTSNVKNFIRLENENFETDHSIVCFIVAKMWELPDSVRYAIYYHSETDLGYYKEPSHKQLSILLRMAESFVADMNSNRKHYSPFASDGLSMNEILPILDTELGINHEIAEELYEALESFLYKN